ncbi:hypothetical protein D3C76_1702070 [compost metagenome]
MSPERTIFPLLLTGQPLDVVTIDGTENRLGLNAADHLVVDGKQLFDDLGHTPAV